MPDYVVTLEPAWTGYEAFVPDIAHCSAGGDTADEALANTRQEIESFASLRRENNLPLPEERTTIVSAQSIPDHTELSNYLVLMEHLPDEFHAYLPDVIGVNGTGQSASEALQRLAAAFSRHCGSAISRGDTLAEPVIEARIVSI